MTPEIMACLRRAGFDPLKTSVRPLSGGITNRNYLVRAGKRDLVLRLGGKRAEALGIDRKREAACARLAARRGLGAKVVAYLPKEGALLSDYLAGRPLSRPVSRLPRTLRLVGAALRRLHSGPAFPGTFSPFATVERYSALARKAGVHLPAGLAQARRRLASIEKIVGRRPLLPCHNDLLPANLIIQGARLRLIDWEYAGMGDPYFDLGNYAANASLSAKGCEALLRAYCGAAKAEDLRLLSFMRAASDLREACWGFLQAGVSDLDFDFMAYGRKHLERFRRESHGR